MFTLPYKNKRNLTLIETILLSILFHAAFLAYLPSQKLNDSLKSIELDIDILINEPEPVKEIIPEPVKEIIPEPVKEIIPEPVKEIIPEPVKEIIPEPVKKVTQVPKRDFISQPKKETQPNNFVIKKKMESYSTTITKAISKQKRYPRIAQMRGWQGEIIAILEIDGQGNLITSKIDKTSGFKILDKEVIAMIKRASPLPAPPLELQSKVLTINVPISFKLQP
ncbi:MAG: TonB family protein [Methylophilaceae bacterium]